MSAAAGVEVAETILQQLGGTRRLVTMTGAHNFVGGPNHVTFRIKAQALQKINVVRITLDPSDTSSPDSPCVARLVSVPKPTRKKHGGRRVNAGKKPRTPGALVWSVKLRATPEQRAAIEAAAAAAEVGVGVYLLRRATSSRFPANTANTANAPQLLTGLETCSRCGHLQSSHSIRWDATRGAFRRVACLHEGCPCTEYVP